MSNAGICVIPRAKQGSGRIMLVELLRAVRAGMVPAFRAWPPVQGCAVWVERAAVAAYLGSGNER